MKRFLQRAAMLLVLFGLLAQGVSWLGFRSGLLLRSLTGREVYQALQEARRPSAARIVLLGDSVGTQLYTFHGRPRNDVRVLCSNAAISMAGQYIVLLEALRAGMLRDCEVVLAYHPDSFRFDLQDKYTYQYFLKPFFRRENRPLLSDTVMERLRPIPWHRAVFLPAVRYSNWTPRWQGPTPPIGRRSSAYIRDVSAEYLVRLADLARREGFALHVVPPPICDSWAATFDPARFQAEVRELGLEDLFGPYIADLPVRPRDWFRDDDVIHLRASKLQELGDDPLRLRDRIPAGRASP